ncbi:hypothetical protein D3C81_947150 [compost metagenome]
MVDDVVLAGRQAEVFAAERDDLVVDLDSGQRCQSVRLQTGTGHQLTGLPGLVITADGDAVAALDDRAHGGRQLHFAACGLDHPGHGLAHLLVIDDAGGIEKQPAEADDVRLAALQFSGVEAFDFQAILL